MALDYLRRAIDAGADETWGLCFKLAQQSAKHCGAALSIVPRKQRKAWKQRYDRISCLVSYANTRRAQ